MSETTPPILPQALIDRHTISEHVAFADQYFDGRDRHNYLYQKPFFHPRDCAPSITNLGQLLADLRLQTQMLEDVWAKAQEAGLFADAWQHYERFGRTEGRRGRS